MLLSASAKICIPTDILIREKSAVSPPLGRGMLRDHVTFAESGLGLPCEKTLPYALICVQKGYVRIDGPLSNMRQRVPMTYLSTKEVAALVGIGRGTLERWLATGGLPPPCVVQVGQGNFRQWTHLDVERTRKFKHLNYRKGRGRQKSAGMERGK